MKAWISRLIFICPLIGGCCVGQTAKISTEPQFEVAVIKPESRPATGARATETQALSCHGIDGTQRASLGINPSTASQGRCAGRYIGLRDLVAFAYEMPVGTTPLGRALFQVQGQAAEPSSATVAELRQMLQALLVDRFKLKLHRITRQVDGLALAVGKNGQTITPADAAEDLHFAREDDQHVVIKGRSSMRGLAEFLTPSGSIGCRIVDRTNLSGIYDFDLRLTLLRVPIDGAGGEKVKDVSTADAAADCRNGTELLHLIGASRDQHFSPSLSDSLLRQVGLRLELQKVPIEIIEVDEAQVPSEN